MEEATLIQLRIPEKFNHRLSIYLLKLKQTGVKKSKAQLILDLAQKGFDNEKRNSEKL